MDIRITKQSAFLGLDIKFPSVNLQSKSAEIKHKPGGATLNIHQESGKIHVDADSARAALNYYDYGPFMENVARKGQQAALQGIARRTQEGFQMSDIHKNGFILPKMVADAAWDSPKEVEVKSKPPAIVKGKPGKVDIKIDFKLTQFEVSSSEFQSDFNWGKVERYLKQKDFIEIEWIGSNIDQVR